MDRGLDRIVSAVIGEASRLQRRRVRRARNDAPATDHVTGKETTMEDVNRLSEALAQTERPEDRQRLIDEARAKAAAAERAGQLDAEAGAELERIAATEPTPARADVLRDRALELLAERLDTDTDAYTGIESLAIAANALDQIVARQAAAAPVAPAINVERLAADVWNALQEVDVIGDYLSRCAPATEVGDAAVRAIRKVLG